MLKSYFPFVVLVFLSFMLISSSCTDPCKDIVCDNGGVCNEGNCVCLNGYTGFNCEEIDIFAIQALFDQGLETPMSLYEKGVALNDIYGNIYEGGFLFFLDVNDDFPGLEGIIASPENLSDSTFYGCYSNLTGATGIAVGEGPANTQKLIVCGRTNENDAARLCDELVANGKDDWFLPAREEMDLMYKNLFKEKSSNIAGFTNVWYWTSTEKDEYEAYRRFIVRDIDPSIPDAQPMDKQFGAGVRAARYF